MSERIKPGYYWAQLKTPRGGTLHGIPGHPNGIRIDPEIDDDGTCTWASLDWEIVHVWDNNSPNDPDEYVGVSVPGIPVTQWPNDFVWGPIVPDDLAQVVAWLREWASSEYTLTDDAAFLRAIAEQIASGAWKGQVNG